MSQNDWAQLERWSPAASLVAGGLYGIDAVVMALDMVTPVAVSGGVFVVLFVSALILTLVGILGCYPSVSEKRPRLARISVAPIAGAGMLLPVTFGWAIVASLLNRTLPPGSLSALIIGLIFLELLLFGIASARFHAPSWIGGLLILGLVAIWGSWFAGVAVWGPHHLPGWWSPIFTAGTAVTTLAFGYSLHRPGPLGHRRDVAVAH